MADQALEFDPLEFAAQYRHDKERIARNWFFVGAELSRIKRDQLGTKAFGQAVATSKFAKIPPHDRSSAVWMFENWLSVLLWLRKETGQVSGNAFLLLAELNVSHPAHIKRKVREFLSQQRANV